ncbi:MAG: NUDIX domain-containing protein [Clostridia bacterium]|nr:NUDIX domain-containing protein [Clostridia bacterium]
MHKIFGEKENAPYLNREGAYLIPLCGESVAVIETPKGYFLIGGGIEAGEAHETCLHRECLEETGCEAAVGECIGSAEAYTVHPVLGHFHPIQTYYLGRLSAPVTPPSESDHRLVWLSAAEAVDAMYSEMQSWAIARAMERVQPEGGR